MADFTWSDRLSAFSSCLPCLRPAGAIRLPPDADSPAPDANADAFSLHSAPGRRKRPRNVLRRQPRRASAMVVALLGRGAARAESADAQDAADALAGGSALGADADADAAPLDDATLARLARGSLDVQRFHPRRTTSSAPSTPLDAPDEQFDSAFALSAEDAEAAARAQAERRARRAERKALKKAALALSLGGAHDPDAAFEGFQGSGDAPHAGMPSPFRRDAPDTPGLPAEDDADDADADFGAAAYARPRRAAGDDSSADRTSDSRSRTSASRSASGATPTSAVFPAERPRRSKSSKSSRARSSKTGTSASASGSSAAPRSPAAGAFPPDVRVHVAAHDADAELADVVAPAAEALAAPPMERFPSAGLGGAGPRRKAQDAGAFLAMRGGF